MEMVYASAAAGFLVMAFVNVFTPPSSAAYYAPFAI
jgi:hypothetical protein